MMPFGLIFHEADAFSFNRMRDDQAWLSFFERDGAEGPDQLGEIMAVDFTDRISERFKFIAERFQRHDVFGRPGYLKPVAIDEKRFS